MSAGVTINLKVEIAKAQRAIKRLGRKLETRQYLELVGSQLLHWVNQNFKDQGTEKKWKPLTPNTKAGRRKEGKGAKILQNTGRLKQSFVSKVMKDGNSVSVGTNNKVAKWHEFGTKPYVIRPKNKKMLKFPVVGGFAFAKKVNHPGLPARPMLPSEDRGRQIALEELKNYVKIITAEANA